MKKEFVNGLGNVYTIEKPFDEALALLGKNKLITSRDLAYARIQTGKNSNFSQRGSYTRESPIYSKDVSLLVLDSPLQNIELAKKAVQANKNGNYFQLENKKQFKKYLNQAEKDLKKEPEKRKVLILPSENNFDISRTNNFDFVRGLFKDQAEDYLKFLENSKQKISSIKFYPVSKEKIDKAENPILTEMWLYKVGGDDQSDLFGYDRGLDGDSRVRGVESLRSRGATELAKNFTKKDLNDAEREYKKLLKILQPNQLEKVGGLIAKLKQ